MSTGLNNFTLDDDEEGQVELSQPASLPTATIAPSLAAAAEAALPTPTPAPQPPQPVSASSERESSVIVPSAFAHPPANTSLLQRSGTSLARSAAAEMSAKKAIETAQQIRSLTPTTSILTVKFVGPPGEAVDPELGLKSLAHAIQLLHENCDRIEEAEVTLQVGYEPALRACRRMEPVCCCAVIRTHTPRCIPSDSFHFTSPYSTSHWLPGLQPLLGPEQCSATCLTAGLAPC